MVRVRAARPEDAQAIRHVHLSAFETSVEADLVDRLTSDGDAVISLVAEDGERVVGHVLFSRMTVDGDGQVVDALGLAPVAVLQEHQNGGVGSMLIASGIEEARKSGVQMVFLLGEPCYYRRFGFDAATAAPFGSPYAGRYFQAKVLVDNFRAPTSGRAAYARAFAEMEP